jgi:hypothetical protein
MDTRVSERKAIIEDNQKYIELKKVENVTSILKFQLELVRQKMGHLLLKSEKKKNGYELMTLNTYIKMLKKIVMQVNNAVANYNLNIAGWLSSADKLAGVEGDKIKERVTQLHKELKEQVNLIIGIDGSVHEIQNRYLQPKIRYYVFFPPRSEASDGDLRGSYSLSPSTSAHKPGATGK